MKLSVWIQICVLAVFAFEANAWRGATDAFDGPVGEYVRTLKKSYREDGSSHAQTTQRGRRMKSGSAKSPAPTALAATCAPSVFVAAPSKRAKKTVRSRKTQRSVKSCKTSVPAAATTCAPTVAPTPSPGGKTAKSVKNSFSCKSASRRV